MDSDTTPLVVGLVVLGVVLFVVITLGVILFCFILRKLRQHERDIIRLSDAENGTLKHADKVSAPVRDSAIELNDAELPMANGRRRPLSQASDMSNQSRVQARMTIMIQKEQANIYGNTPPLGQVMMTAQHYYKVKTNTGVDVPVESVQMVDKITFKRSAISRVLTDDWKEGVPTSLLFDGSAHKFDDAFSLNKGLFVHKTIGPGGGHLKISGVSLEIPPNALEEEKFISLGVLWDEKHAPLVTQKQCMLSPIVLCQPNGLKFKTPVTLTFPHAAINVTSDWIPKVLKRERALTEQHDWVPITLADYEERDVNDHHIRLKLNHFTLYTCVGESKPGKMAAKHVHFVAFTGKLQKGSFFKPRIYCLNKYKDELEEVEFLVGKMDPNSKMSDTTDLIIHDNDQDVMVEMAKLAEDWNLAGERTEPSSPLSSIEDDPIENLKKELVILLDPQNEVSTDAGDWRNLAEKMECGLARIRWLGTQSSPTQILIEKWLEEGKGFKELEDIMKDINREDAAEEIRKRLPDFEKSTDT